MATVARPSILAYQLGVAQGNVSNRFIPADNESWEVHSIVVSKAATIFRDFDPTGAGSWDVQVEHDSIAEAGEFHGFKWELDRYCGIRVRNDGTGTMHVVLVGVKIS